MAANSLIEASSGYLRWRAFDRVSLRDEGADRLFREAIVHIESEDVARTFPIRGVDTQEKMAAHVVPIRLSARDVFARCVAGSFAGLGMVLNACLTALIVPIVIRPLGFG